MNTLLGIFFAFSSYLLCRIFNTVYVQIHEKEMGDLEFFVTIGIAICSIPLSVLSIVIAINLIFF